MKLKFPFSAWSLDFETQGVSVSEGVTNNKSRTTMFYYSAIYIGLYPHVYR